MKISRIILILTSIAVATPAMAQLVSPKKNVWSDGTGWQTLGPSGTWWRDQKYVTLLSLTTDQQKKMDDVFQQARIKLIDVTATLNKEEAILEPLLLADRLDESKVALQIDKVADARAELEKVNARMLLGIRQILTPEQWTKLNPSPRFYYQKAKPFKE
jgi:Spy/CpxP family protein refolding chaperone